jgi:hypothetical protein
MAFSRQFLRCFALSILLPVLMLTGCAHFEPHASRDYVYVWVKEASLRDRVAVVSNRVAEVVNGQKLQVVEQGHRFVKVKTDRGEIGWIEGHEVIDQKVYDTFDQLEKDHAHDPVVATGVLLDDYWLRDAPGRTSDRYYLLPGNAKLEMLERASIPRPKAPEGAPRPTPTAADHGKNVAGHGKNVAGQGKNAVGQGKDAAPIPPPPDLEDYWLVRDGAGHVGWVRARSLDEDVPDAIAGLGEGQKIVGAYVLRTVSDPDANVPGGQVPEYIAVLAAWKDGLPYDFDQVRVFTWNVKKHRYETAYRERNIAGYLPVTVGQQVFGRQTEPVFSFRVATGDAVALDLQTGTVRPGDTITESFHMEGVVVRRIGGDTGARAAVTGNAPGRHEKSRKKVHG